MAYSIYLKTVKGISEMQKNKFSSLTTLAAITTIASCSMYSANETGVPFDANNQHCKQLWRDIHTKESKTIQNHQVNNQTGQVKDLSQLDIERNHKVMQYERDCELPANFNERDDKNKEIKVKS